MNSISKQTAWRIAGASALVAFTLITGLLVIWSGRSPTVFTSLFFFPVMLAAYRYSLTFALVVALLASLFSSPAMTVAGVEMVDSVMPVLWLGWPAVYLFIAVSVNQWTAIQLQKKQLEATEEHLMEVRRRNDQREQELETLSAIHSTVLAGTDAPEAIAEITRRVADVCGAKFCTIVLPGGFNGERQFTPVGFTLDDFKKFFPDGPPQAEGVAAWAMLHRRVAASRNVFEDARYDRLRAFARAVGYTSSAAAPVELDDGVYGALVICYPEERDFTPDELARLERLARQTELAVRSVRQRETLSRFAFETALALTEAIESRDPYTGGHCRRLADYAGLVAERLALPPREVEIVRLGAALHDMGKIVVPDSILKKPGKLTPEEYTIIKQHCYSGGQICKRVGFLMNAYPIVYHHHERWDGNGYPDGLKGERIPQGARIVAVIDAFDAMTSDRPYRQAMPLEEALAILRDGAGTQWDPVVVRTMLEIVDEMRAKAPPGNGRRPPEHAAAAETEDLVRPG